MRRKSKFASIGGVILTAICVVPFVYLLIKSLRAPSGGVTGTYYYQVFLGQSQFHLRFWKSLGLSACIATGQMVVSTLAGYSFAKHRYRGQNVVFFLLMSMMILPVQVTLVPNYTMLDALGLLDTYYALALPMIFVPLGTFIMTQSFRAVPNEIIEAARLDGCGVLGIIWRIAIPMSKAGLVCTMLLSFLDGWNMVEQPVAFLREAGRYPFAVALASTPPADPGVQLVCCIFAALPPVLLFAFFSQELVEGIAAGGGK